MKAILLGAILGLTSYLSGLQGGGSVGGLVIFLALLANGYHAVLAASIFIADGKGMLTVRGAFAIGSFGFLVLPISYYSMTGGEDQYIHSLSGAALYSFCVINALIGKTRGGAGFDGIELGSYKRPLVIIGGLSIALMVIIPGGRLLNVFSDGLVTTAVVAGAFLLFFGDEARWRISGLLIISIGLSTFLTSFFSGFGRLMLLSYALVVLNIMTLNVRSRALKVVAALLAPMFLLWAISVRANYSGDLFGGLGEGVGLGSLLDPVRIGAAILADADAKADSRWPLLWGGSYRYVVFDYWIPRFIWPDKPDGLGTIYSHFAMPSLAEKGHNVAVSYVGEMLLNFGIAGPIFVPLVLGLFFRAVRKRASLRVDRGVPRIFWLSVSIILIASVPEFIWADSNTYVQRGFTRLLVFFVLYSVVFYPFGLFRRKRDW